MSRTPEGKAFTQIILEVFQLNHLFHEISDDLAKPVGLTSARWQMLGVIEDEPMPVSNVGRLMGLSRQTIQQTADRLAEDGLVEYLDNPHHIRAKLVQITQQGSQALQKVRKAQIGWSNQLGGGYALSDLEDALDVLRQIKASLEVNPQTHSKQKGRKL